MREIKVAETFQSKSVLVTGATGFLGKVLVEKLLRSVTGIDKVYVLIRSKDGKGIQDRFDDFKKLTVFDRLKHSQALEKLVPIEGDLTISPNAGISNGNLKTLNLNVSFVFHCAALTDFQATMKNAIRLNIIGTRNILDIAEKFHNIESFVHVSTAFSNSNRWKLILEEIYKPLFDYKNAIEFVESGNDDELEKLSKSAFKTFTNAYIFTKNMSEQLVNDRSDRFSISLVRPSFISPCVKEPYPGFVEPNNGPASILAFKTIGTLRSFYGNGSKVVDLIPCDFVANTVIVAGASAATCENKKLKVYNCLSSRRMPLAWSYLFEIGCEAYEDCPSETVAWFPGGRSFSNYILFMLYFIVFQLLPACIFDLILFASRKPTWALQFQKSVFKSLHNLKYFTHTSWDWDVTNFELLHKILALEERRSFNFDISSLDYREYMKSWTIGVRRYLLKLDDKSIPEAKRKYRILYWLDTIVKTLLYYFLFHKFYQFYYVSKVN